MCWCATPAADTPRRRSQRPAGTSGRATGCVAAFSTGRLRFLTGIEQPVQVHDEVTHMSVIHRLLRLRLPRRIGGRVIRKNADDFHLVEILEGRVFKIGELAADHEMKQLLRATVAHAWVS